MYYIKPILTMNHGCPVPEDKHNRVKDHLTPDLLDKGQRSNI